MAGSDSDVTFYFGLGSRYSYLAATQIPAIQSKIGERFEWRPLMSTCLTASTGTSAMQWDEEHGEWWGARISGQYREAYRQRDLARWAGYYDVPYHEPQSPAMDPKRRTLFCVAATIAGEGQRYASRMFEAIYAESLVIDESMCQDIAAEVDLSPESITALIDSGEADQAHTSWLDEAEKAGVFGVPSFVYQDSVFWGNDRLVLLEQALSR